MHDQINHDEDCTLIALEIMKMRTVMRELVAERCKLGDNEPIVVQSLFIARRAPAPSRVAKRRLVPPSLAQRALTRRE
ncbi:hypothetical protein [Bradyrhizobium sp. CCBAU 53380]|uniref:hypothetical protein n=1 Tax=Bradyrhizobium sp. CCBAU 53380 TaxID=1325117 RepID=UPI00230318A1|nr:hypothetical protein [Bradyrhizobium sp. CCBAU 53380]